MTHQIRIPVIININDRTAAVFFVLVLLLSLPLELGSESINLSTTYPSPVGIYNQIITIGTGPKDTVLSRDHGNVVMGSATRNPPAVVQLVPYSGAGPLQPAPVKGGIYFDGTQNQYMGSVDGVSWSPLGIQGNVQTAACNAWSCAITLPSGNWMLRIDAFAHQIAWDPASIKIDGTVLQTTEDFGDQQGTGYVVMFGEKRVTGGTHTGVITATSTWGTPRIMLTAIQTQ